MTHNPNCDGSHCRYEEGTVKIFPLGGSGNLILCSACWAHENNYRLARGYETKNKANWPTVNWKDAKVYEGATIDAALEEGCRYERAFGDGSDIG